MSDQEMYYLGGLFDGEGSCGVYATKSRPGWAVRAGCQMCERQGVDLLAATFGGNIHLYRAAVSQIERGINAHPIWNWAISSGRAMRCLVALEPFTRVKAGQIRLVLETVAKLDSMMRTATTAQIIAQYRKDLVAMYPAGSRSSGRPKGAKDRQPRHTEGYRSSGPKGPGKADFSLF